MRSLPRTADRPSRRSPSRGARSTTRFAAKRRRAAVSAPESGYIPAAAEARRPAAPARARKAVDPTADDALSLYLQEMGATPLLDRDEELVVARRLERLRRRYRR